MRHATLICNAGQLHFDISKALLADAERTVNRDGADAGKNANASSGWAEDDEPDAAQSSSWALHELPDVGRVRRMLAMPASERSHKASYAQA